MKTKTTTTPKGAQHTPGPWIAAREDWRDYEGHRIETSDRCIAVTTTVEAAEVTDEDKANAYLLAAAPSLLDLAETVAYQLNGLNATLRDTDKNYANTELCRQLCNTVSNAVVILANIKRGAE